MAIKPQPHDERHVMAAETLGLTLEQVLVQHVLISTDMIYAWNAPLGHAVLVNSDLRALSFEPGVLLQDALARFRRS